jgi:beta-glucuronidase
VGGLKVAVTYPATRPLNRCFRREASLLCVAFTRTRLLHFSRLLIPACIAAVAVVPATAAAQVPAPEQLPPAPPPAPTPELRVERPGGKPLIQEGQPTRQLLGGTWYFRLDDALTTGDTERWYAQRDLDGWTAVNVPHNWNAADVTLDKSSVGWYRKEFKVPLGDKRERRDQLWKVRFEGSNYRTRVWLNGKPIGGQTGMFPFEADLTGLRKGRNSLVVKVSSLRGRTDLTHWRPAAFNGYGTGGWWNFGGLLREVYMRKVDTLDVENVLVTPRLRKVGGPAKVEVQALLRNVSREDRDVSLVLTVGKRRYVFDPERVDAGASRELKETFMITRPRLWQPRRPALYDLNVAAVSGGARRASYRVTFGVKKLAVGRGGTLLLNGRRLNLRGASVHEDDLEEGGALSQGTRNLLVSRLKDLGATVTRSHYPLHPAFIEALDRAGILYWCTAPVYQIPNSYFPRVNRAGSRAAVQTVRNNMNHASILAWSLGNELGGNRSELGEIGSGLQSYIKDASTAVREVDDTHPIAIDRQSRVDEPLTSPAYRYLDVLGVNEYFGWYPSYIATEKRGPTTLDELSPYLDALHAANPRMPLVITEFGAEAARRGPVEQRGSEEFQRRFVLDHLAVHASKRYIYGSINWALRDFRVDPTWQGGASPAWSTPPWNNKSLIDQTDARKLAYFALKRQWRKTRPLR